MKEAEARKAMENGWRVQITRYFQEVETYRGTLTKRFKEGLFWFHGQADNGKILMARVKAEEVSLVGKEG